MVITCRILPLSASSPEKCPCISDCTSNVITKQTAIFKWWDNMKQFLPCSHVLLSWRSFTPVGQAHEWPCVFNKHKWLHPPLVIELHGLSPVISRQSSYLKMVIFKAFMNPWTIGKSSGGLVIRRPRVQVLLWPLAGFVHGSPEFKFLATLVKQPTGSPSTSWDLNHFMFHLNYFFHYPWKSTKGKRLLSNDPGKVDSNLFCYAATVLFPHRNVLIFAQRMHKPTWKSFTQ